MPAKTTLRYLESRWDARVASAHDEPELLRYRSNLLGSDLRITNFGGGNTSSKSLQTKWWSCIRSALLARMPLRHPSTHRFMAFFLSRMLITCILIGASLLQ